MSVLNTRAVTDAVINAKVKRGGERFAVRPLQARGARRSGPDAYFHRPRRYNCGQACISVERVYVHERIYDEFVAKLSAEVAAIRDGTETDHSFTNDIGALVTSTQVGIVERQVADAVAKGARVLTGGQRREPGNFFLPTVLVDVDHSMDCMREEAFGPTLPVMKVASEDEAVALANDSHYGLAGSVWTSDVGRAERVAKRLETGGVSANNALATLFQSPLPFGGWNNPVWVPALAVRIRSRNTAAHRPLYPTACP